MGKCHCCKLRVASLLSVTTDIGDFFSASEASVAKMTVRKKTPFFSINYSLIAKQRVQLKKKSCVSEN